MAHMMVKVQMWNITLLRIATGEHLTDESIVVGAVVKWMMVFKSVPMIVEDLFEYIPSGSDFCFHG